MRNSEKNVRLLSVQINRRVCYKESDKM